MIKSLEKFLNLESAFIGASKISHRVFLLEGVDNNLKKQGLKKYTQVVYNSDYMPLLKIGG